MAKRRGGTDPDGGVDPVASVDEDAVDELDEDSIEDDDDELDDDLDDEDDEEAIPAGFSVVDPDDVVADDDADEPAVVVEAVSDGARAVAVLEAASREVVVDGEDEDGDDELAVRRAGEFICSRCHLVKRDVQLARPRLRICRDCA